MKIRIASTEKHNVDEAVFDLMTKFASNNMETILYQASENLDREDLEAKIMWAFENVAVFRCSSPLDCVAIPTGGAVVAVAFHRDPADTVDFEVIEAGRRCSGGGTLPAGVDRKLFLSGGMEKAGAGGKQA